MHFSIRGLIAAASVATALLSVVPSVNAETIVVEGSRITEVEGILGAAITGVNWLLAPDQLTNNPGIVEITYQSSFDVCGGDFGDVAWNSSETDRMAAMTWANSQIPTATRAFLQVMGTSVYVAYRVGGQFFIPSYSGRAHPRARGARGGASLLTAT